MGLQDGCYCSLPVSASTNRWTGGDFQTCCCCHGVRPAPLPDICADERTDRLPDLLLLRSAGPTDSHSQALLGQRLPRLGSPSPPNPNPPKIKNPPPPKPTPPLQHLPGVARQCCCCQICTIMHGPPGRSLLQGTALDPATWPLPRPLLCPLHSSIPPPPSSPQLLMRDPSPALLGPLPSLLLP
jgi:hypothetical protein